ncbi:hsc70-interacting protein isoform X1 [Hydra vulgaris]|uniref:hsc70-interacting protein isoform X1 n=1 Tax=Hydra vulgaris TaxID=6087 RepID=UPI0001926551|nr:hsc70-interacting protein [Hydra vulgaris]XP_012554235.1 hsc70-interacting protein [Hydra vulgaris]
MFDKSQLDLLKQFISAIKAKPDILYSKDLSFFKEWLISLGANLPEPSQPKSSFESKHNKHEDEDTEMPDIEEISAEKVKTDHVHHEEDSNEDIIESDVDIEELDGIIKDELEVDLQMGDESIEVSEEMIEESNVKRCAAQSAQEEGNFDEALKGFTEAILVNPKSASLYAKRASILLKLKRPNAAISDCNKALSLNKDSAQPYKWRGRAYRLLGKYEEAYHDFQTSCRLDMDETTYEWQKEVEPNAKKIMEHRRKYERLREEKEIEKKLKEAKRRKEEAQKQYEHSKKQNTTGASGGFPGGFPGGMPGAGAGGMPDLNALFSDPELMAAMQDPEVMAAFQDVSKNPANISKYENNPKIKKVIEKLQTKFGAGGI